jgi:hypothetical protein
LDAILQIELAVLYFPFRQTTPITLLRAKTAAPLETVAPSDQFNEALDAFGKIGAAVAGPIAAVISFHSVLYNGIVSDLEALELR